MKSDSQLIAAAHLSFIDSFAKLVEHSPRGAIHSTSPVFTFATGLQASLFNGCVVVEPATSEQLAGSLQWLGRLAVPYQVSIAEDLALGLVEVVLAHGLEEDPVPYPGMVLHPVPAPPVPPPGVTVLPGTVPGLADYLPASFVADPDVRVFHARLDGRPVGNSVAIRTGDVSGVYAVGTLPEARGRGIGTAVTWAAVAAGSAWGCDVVVLQASEMGLALYERLGFRTAVRYITFTSGQ